MRRETALLQGINRGEGTRGHRQRIPTKPDLTGREQRQGEAEVAGSGPKGNNL